MSIPARMLLRSAPAIWTLALLFIVGFLGQALLWINPGYFSHDELQWGFYADVADVSDLRWVSWTDSSVFQFRPLTFNLWQLLSHYLFATPALFHAVFVALGTLNALLLLALVRAEAGTRAGLVAFAAFLSSPYVALVHGWVATLADLLWVAAALLAALLVRSTAGVGREWMIAAGCLLLTTIGLLAKESALAIPALLGCGWMLSGWCRRWGYAFAGSVIAGLLYLLLRLEPVVTGSGGGVYDWTPAMVPMRWLEYLLFPWAMGWLEPNEFLRSSSPKRLLVAVLLFLCLLSGMVRAWPRLVPTWLLGGLCALGPTLVLGTSSSQYAYGFAALSAACFAFAWQRGDRAARLLIALPLLAMAAHGVHVQYQMLATGRVQQTFFHELVRELAEHESISITVLGAEWQFRRFTHEVPGYQGTVIGGRVRIVDASDAPSHSVAADGTLESLGR